MRLNGRSPDELRPVKITPGYIDYPEGSALIEVGKKWKQSQLIGGRPRGFGD